jgi:hypothetical protein
VGVGRKERRHPGLEDPVAAAQEEARWSGYTRFIRATNQGKLLFPLRAVSPHGIDRPSLKNPVILALLAGLAVIIVFPLIWLLVHAA